MQCNIVHGKYERETYTHDVVGDCNAIEEVTDSEDEASVFEMTSPFQTVTSE